MTNAFRDQEKFMRACDQTTGTHNSQQYALYLGLIDEESKELDQALADNIGYSEIRSIFYPLVYEL